MKRFFTILLAAFLATSLFAQNTVLRQRLELAESEDETYGINLEVFKMQDNGKYYLSVGNLGIGSDILQIKFDPVYELFIPLGETLEQAMETMKDIKDFYKMSRKQSKIIDGCLCAAYPDDKFEPVTVTRRQFLATKVLEFGVQRDDFVRATHISKNNFNAVYTSLKLYKKLHPKEK